MLGVAMPIIFAELKAELLAVLGMQDILTEIANVGVRLFIYSDQRDLPRDRLVAMLHGQHCRHVDRRGHADQIIAHHAADLRHMPGRIDQPVHAVRFDNHVGQNAVQPHVHLAGEPRHDAIDDDQRADAQRDADDRGQGDIPRPQVSPGEQQFIHRPRPIADL